MKLHLKSLAQAIVAEASTLPKEDHGHLLDAVISMLEEKGQIRLLRLLPSYLEAAVYEEQGIAPVTVATPSGKAEHHTSLVKALEEALQKKIELREESDPSLLGGVRIAVGDERLDFSLATALHEAATHLSRPS